MGGFPDQEKIDIYYENKKMEIKEWLVEYANNQKRISNQQRERILKYADSVTFSNIGEINNYIQNLNRIGKKEKQAFLDYSQKIEWLPEGIRSGVLDGQIVTKIVPNDLDLLFEEKMGNK